MLFAPVRPPPSCNTGSDRDEQRRKTPPERPLPRCEQTGCLEDRHRPRDCADEHEHCLRVDSTHPLIESDVNCGLDRPARDRSCRGARASQPDMQEIAAVSFSFVPSSLISLDYVLTRVSLPPTAGMSDVDMERLRALCGRYGIARLDVFGSVARGEAGPGSDVDLLYALAPGHSLGWEIEDLSDALSELMGAPVDLVSRAGLHPLLRDAVLREARPIYAAA